MSTTSAPGPLVVIVGETASGKSALAIELAKRFNGEIICADSWTVRREVNIGTAKPTTAEQAAAPHHLIDIVGPDEDFTAAVFKRLAQDKIDEISARGKLPILAGGTGLYVDGIIYDYGFLPAGDRADREALNLLSAEDLLSKVKYLCLDTTGIDVHNKRRLIRLIETNGAIPAKHEQRANTLMLGIATDREVLLQRVTNRTDAMLAAGLEDEVRQLAGTYGWNCEGLKGVGYSQWREYFEGTQSLEETRQKIIKATMDLAKRQRTWFKRNKSIHWLTSEDKTGESVAQLTAFLGK